MSRTQTNAANLRPVFSTYYPLERLWSDAPGAALFPSENSARWFIRNHKPELVAAEAIAMHTGRMLVEPEKFAEVARVVAISKAKKRTAEHE